MVFTDPVKDFNTSNHTLLIAILGKYGAPPRLLSAIKRMYEKSIVKLIIGKVETPTFNSMDVYTLPMMSLTMLL